jgi:hypothetical protein
VRGFVVFVVLGLTASVASAEVDPKAIEAARRAVLDKDYQTRNPRYETGEAGAGSGSAVPRRRVRDARGNLRDQRYYQEEMRLREREREQQSPFASFLMWGVLIALAIVLAIAIVSELKDGDKDPEIADEPDAQRKLSAAADAILERPLGDADELARRGEFAEAIHTLLLRTLQELVRSAAVRVTPSMTSREILARVPLLADAREAFAGLITAVEITHFGDEPANATDYQRCREQFHVFATALRAGASRGAA